MAYEYEHSHEYEREGVRRRMGEDIKIQLQKTTSCKNIYAKYSIE